MEGDFPYRCKTCETISEILGKRFFMNILEKNWEKINKVEVEPMLKDLRIRLIGGLERRGWTTHDIDILGDRKNVFVLEERLNGKGIQNPIHLCGNYDGKHSHLKCLYNGAKLVLGLKGY